MSQQPLPQDRHYAADDVKIIEKSAGYNGFFKVNVYRLQHRLFAGGWNQPIVRELFDRRILAALGFLDLGAQLPSPEWGAMLGDALELIYVAPWTVMLPGAAIMVSVLLINLLGDGIRRAINAGVQ